MTTRLTKNDVYESLQSRLALPQAGESNVEALEAVVKRLIANGFDDETILRKTYRTNDLSRETPQKTIALDRIRRLRAEAGKRDTLASRFGEILGVETSE